MRCCKLPCSVHLVGEDCFGVLRRRAVKVPLIDYDIESIRSYWQHKDDGQGFSISIFLAKFWVLWSCKVVLSLCGDLFDPIHTKDFNKFRIIHCIPSPKTVMDSNQIPSFGAYITLEVTSRRGTVNNLCTSPGMRIFFRIHRKSTTSPTKSRRLTVNEHEQISEQSYRGMMMQTITTKLELLTTDSDVNISKISRLPLLQSVWSARLSTGPYLTLRPWSRCGPHQVPCQEGLVWQCFNLGNQELVLAYIYEGKIHSTVKSKWWVKFTSHGLKSASFPLNNLRHTRVFTLLEKNFTILIIAPRSYLRWLVLIKFPAISRTYCTSQTSHDRVTRYRQTFVCSNL